MNNEVWLKVLQKIADEEEIPFSQVPKSVREKLQQWGESSGAVSLQRSQAGAGRVFKVINLRIVEKEIVSLDPNVDVNSLSSSRLRNLAINKDTKAGATTLECSYYFCKAIGDKVVVDGIDVSEVSKMIGSALPSTRATWFFINSILRIKKFISKFFISFIVFFFNKITSFMLPKFHQSSCIIFFYSKIFKFFQK